MSDADMGKPSRSKARHHLRVARLGPRQVQRVESVGWTKRRLYVHLLTRQNYEAWTTFALSNRTKVISQAAARARPGIAPEPVRTILFRLSESVRDELVKALNCRGSTRRVGVRGGRRGKPREPDDGPVRKLLRDARRGWERSD